MEEIDKEIQKLLKAKKQTGKNKPTANKKETKGKKNDYENKSLKGSDYSLVFDKSIQHNLSHRESSSIYDSSDGDSQQSSLIDSLNEKNNLKKK